MEQKMNQTVSNKVFHFTPTERELLYKFSNLITRYSFTDWSYSDLSKRWRVAKKTLVAFFQKLKKLGFLIESRNHYHEVIRSLTNEAIKLIKSGAFSIKKMFEKMADGNRSETDRKPIKPPFKEELQPKENEGLREREIRPPIHTLNHNILNDNESLVQDLDQACQTRLMQQSEQVKALAIENYETYNKPIQNASRFMNNCINRALDYTKGVWKPKVERSEPKPCPEPTQPKEPPAPS